MADLTLSQLFIYPVKSLAGIQVNSWGVNQTGLLYDRHWMIIDQNNRFLSQREVPEMALIKTALSNEQLTLTAATNEKISIPINQHAEGTVQTQIWQDQCSAHPISNRVDQWLSELLKQPCRLVFQTHEARQVDRNFASPNDQVAFSDGFPFLLISENSLNSLNNQMQAPIPMQRFRPNLVVSGCEAYAEDYWRKISIGDISFRLPKPCSRCAIPNIDTETAQQNKEPLKTLNQHRKWNKQVYFGQNVLHDHTGHLQVGDEIKIQQQGEAQPPI